MVLVGTGIFPDTYKTILLNLRNRPQNKPYHIITHTEIQRKQVERIFGIFNTTDYPVTYITKHEKDRILSIDKKEWKTKHGFTGTDILIGTFGAWNESKNRIWLLKALEILPDNYKLIFFGGVHPLSIQKFKVNDNTKLIIDFFEERLQRNANRIRCFGVITDDSLFNEAMSCVDFCVAPYYENGQSASGTTSVALELGSKLITTYTNTFVAHRKYWPDSFEMFDIGNHIELRDKILHFPIEKAANAKKNMNNYTPETLAAFYVKLANYLSGSGYKNNVGQIDTASPTIAFSHTNQQTIIHISKFKNSAKKVYKKLKSLI